MSEGIRSGVNWMRLKLTSRIWLIELTIRVLARPGTPTSRQWPRVKMAARICSITSAWPTMTRRSLLDHQGARLAELGQVFADTVGGHAMRFLRSKKE